MRKRFCAETKLVNRHGLPIQERRASRVKLLENHFFEVLLYGITLLSMQGKETSNVKLVENLFGSILIGKYIWSSVWIRKTLNMKCVKRFWTEKEFANPRACIFGKEELQIWDLWRIFQDRCWSEKSWGWPLGWEKLYVLRVWKRVWAAKDFGITHGCPFKREELPSVKCVETYFLKIFLESVMPLSIQGKET